MGTAGLHPTDAATLAVTTEHELHELLVLPDDLDAGTLDDFLVESRENLSDAEAALLELEADPSQSEAIGRTFRAFHTVKSSAGFLGLSSIVAVGHAAEDLLSAMRTGTVRCTGHYAELALRSVDALRICVDAVEKLGAGHPPMALPVQVTALVTDLVASLPTPVLATPDAPDAWVPSPEATLAEALERPAGASAKRDPERW